jgi:beta-glucosidase
MVNDTYAKMKGKPVIVSVNLNNPMVFAELEKQANAIIADFGVQGQASLDILTGKSEPSALLPLQMPLDMKVVEAQV